MEEKWEEIWKKESFYLICYWANPIKNVGITNRCWTIEGVYIIVKPASINDLVGNIQYNVMQ